MTAERRALGHSWNPHKGGWVTRIEPRFSVLVDSGQRGRYHPAVIVDYVHARDGAVGIFLVPASSEGSAMAAGLDWVDQYLATGPLDPEPLISQMFRENRTLLRTRLDTLSTLFFADGCGHCWLDGALVSTEVTPSGATDQILREQREAFIRQMETHACETLSAEQNAEVLRRLRLLAAEEEALPVGPIEDDDQPRVLHQLNDTSNIFVPPDVRPLWLAVAMEAARAYVGRILVRPGDVAAERSQSAVRRILKDLEERVQGEKGA